MLSRELRALAGVVREGKADREGLARILEAMADDAAEAEQQRVPPHLRKPEGVRLAG